ncbi:MAG: glycosyltransferase family 87 protein, partial [Caulobacteraceae bacterium]
MTRLDRLSSASPPLVEALRSGDWLTAERARAYGWIWLAVAASTAAAWVLLSPSGIDPTGKPLGTDFTSFWAASKLALAGAPRGAYEAAAHRAQEAAIFGRDTGYAAFFYPPLFLLACLPLAALPYFAALAAWLVATGAAYVASLRAWLGKSLGVMPILAFPAVLSNLGHGQNGLLSAALFGAGALWLFERPILAGVALGCLAYKPHLGLMIPLALVLFGRWRSFAAASLTVLAFASLSYWAFGAETWRAFLADAGLARAALEQGLVGDAKMQSAFAAVRLWGGPVWLAYAAQACAVLGAAAGLIWLRSRTRKTSAEGPAMVMAALLATPFLLD